MLALRFYGRRDIRLEKMEKPKLQKDEVLIRVIAAGISQTQINEFVEGPFIINKEIHPLTKKAIPLVPSQEFGGIVEEVGEDVDRSWLGKMVAVLPLVTCKKCKSCKEKRENLCENVAYYGLLGLDGGFSEYCAVKSENIFEVKKENLWVFNSTFAYAYHFFVLLSLSYNHLMLPEGSPLLIGHSEGDLQEVPQYIPLLSLHLSPLFHPEFFLLPALLLHI